MSKVDPISKEKSISDVTLNVVNSRKNSIEENESTYDPFASRDQINGNSTGSTLTHILKGHLGSGILAMPVAFKNAGLLFGLIGTIIAGIVCTHCVYILVKTSQRVCRDAAVTALSFTDTAEKVFEYGPKRLRPWSNFAKQFVDGALMMTYYAVTSVYIVFVAQSFHDVINYDFNLSWNIRVYVAITVLPLLLLGQIRNLKYLVPFSAGANVFVVISFAITLYYIFSEPLNISDKPLVASFKQTPIFFATAVFAMEGIGAVMPVENAMKKPQHFLGCPGVLTTAMGIVVGLYAIIGFFGYVRYGDEVLGSITLNLPSGSYLADTAKILMALAILFTYGLQFYVPNEILWRKIGHKFPENKQNITQILLRVGIILISGGFAAAIPHLEPFISLVGAVFFSILGFFIPSLMDTIYLWPDNLGWCKWILIKNIFMIVISIGALIAGSYVSILQIIDLSDK